MIVVNSYQRQTKLTNIPVASGTAMRGARVRALQLKALL